MVHLIEIDHFGGIEHFVEIERFVKMEHLEMQNSYLLKALNHMLAKLVLFSP